MRVFFSLHSILGKPSFVLESSIRLLQLGAVGIGCEGSLAQLGMATVVVPCKFLLLVCAPCLIRPLPAVRKQTLEAEIYLPLVQFPANYQLMQPLGHSCPVLYKATIEACKLFLLACQLLLFPAVQVRNSSGAFPAPPAPRLSRDSNRRG